MAVKRPKLLYDVAVSQVNIVDVTTSGTIFLFAKSIERACTSDIKQHLLGTESTFVLQIRGDQCCTANCLMPALYGSLNLSKLHLVL